MTPAVAKLLASLHGQRAVDELELWTERAAIAQFDGCLSREDAEKLATEELIARLGKKGE